MGIISSIVWHGVPYIVVFGLGIAATKYVSAPRQDYIPHKMEVTDESGRKYVVDIQKRKLEETTIFEEKKRADRELVDLLK